MSAVIQCLNRFPVKSMQGEQLNTATVGPDGIPGDRGFGVIDNTSGRVLSAKRVPALMSLRARYLETPAGSNPGVVAISGPGLSGDIRSDQEDVSRQLSACLQREVTLTPAASRGFFDDAPVHIVSLQSLATMRRHCRDASEFDPRRFRANVIVDMPDEAMPFPEQPWSFRVIATANVSFQVQAGTQRCVMTTFAFDDLPEDPATLTTMMETTRGILGIYAQPKAMGEIALGDEFSLQ